MEVENKTRKMSSPFAESVMKRDGVYEPVAKKAKVSSLPNVVSVQSSGQFSFTMADLQKCLYNASTIHPVNAHEAIGKRGGTACFWCDASSTIPNFNCPRHEHDKSTTRQMTQIPLALRSLPPEVGLCASSIPGTGYGICAKRAIPVGAWIGPYEGTFMKPEKLSSVTDTSYMWEIFNDGKLAGFVDGSDEMVSSWMRFVRCARHRGEQNLFAFQYLGKVYYRSFKIILPGQELLVWYDDKYPQYLGVPSTIFDMGALTAEVATNRPETSGTVLSEERDRTPSKTLTQNQFPPTPPSSVPSPSSPPHSPNSQPMSHQQHSPTRPISGEPFNGFQSEVPSAFDFSSSVTSPGKPQHPILKENLTANQSHPLSPESERSDPGSPISSDDGQGNQAKESQPVFSHITELSLWKCGQCKKSFPQRTMLQVHVCNEAPQKPYQCGHCSLSFSHPAQLRAHAVIHASKKPFKCGYCSRAFAGATTLNNHIRTHTGERPFVCDKCGKNFTQGSQLSRHQRIPGDCVVRA